MTAARRVATLRRVVADMADDAAALEGAPFDGATLGVALGHLMAAVATTARALADHIEESDT